MLIAPTLGYAKTYSCIPPIKIVIDLGYCFGFTTSYFEAINDQQTLTAIEAGHVQKHIIKPISNATLQNLTTK